jgi:hypothetical protein
MRFLIGSHAYLCFVRTFKYLSLSGVIPDQMNTFTSGMMEGLGHAYRQCDEDDAVKVVVVTGQPSASW